MGTGTSVVPSKWRLAKLLGLTVAGGAVAFFAGVDARRAIAGIEASPVPLVARNGAAVTGPAAIDSLLVSDPAEVRNPRLVDWSRATLRKGALNTQALRIFGYAMGVQNNPSAEARAMTLASRVSRRDVLSELWLIEDQVSRGNVKGALERYNIALQTSAVAHKLLFARLSAALEDTEIRHAFAGLIRKQPVWLPQFVIAAINGQDDLEYLERAIAEAGGLPDTTEFHALEPLLLQRLAATGRFDAARRFYATMKGAKPAILSQPGFSVDTIDPRYIPFTWAPGADPLISAVFEPAETDRAVVRVSTAFGGHGRALRRQLFLAPGSYKFSLRLQVIQASSGATYRWSLSCGTETKPFQSWDGTSVDLVIPESCRAQTIELNVGGVESQSGAEILISNLSISPESGNRAQ